MAAIAHERKEGREGKTAWPIWKWMVEGEEGGESESRDRCNSCERRWKLLHEEGVSITHPGVWFSSFLPSFLPSFPQSLPSFVRHSVSQSNPLGQPFCSMICSTNTRQIIYHIAASTPTTLGQSRRRSR